MKIGQMTFNKITDGADYLQLDMCGLNRNEVLGRYLNFNKDIDIILHGDWSKKGCSENNILERVEEYIETIFRLQKITKVRGLTIHPPFRKKVSLEDFLRSCESITNATGTPVFIENRSNSKIWISKPDEIIDFSKSHLMTIDIPQLYIACKYDIEALKNTLVSIHWNNVKELHLANVKRQPPNTFVGRKILDGEIDYSELISFFDNVGYLTLEILGGVNVFEKEKSYLETLLKIDHI
jgi:hypothetical protein